MDAGSGEFTEFMFGVQFLKTDPKSRYQGYTFYFREGFCWSDINTTFLKCRQKQKSINDVKSMSLYSLTEKAPEYYIICLINSKLMSYYVDDFVNNTQTFQINDARQLPIIVPSEKELCYCKLLFDKVISLKKITIVQNLKDESLIDEINMIEDKLDKFVRELYSV